MGPVTKTTRTPSLQMRRTMLSRNPENEHQASLTHDGTRACGLESPNWSVFEGSLVSLVRPENRN